MTSWKKFLEGDEPDVGNDSTLDPAGTLNMSFVPVLCGSAFKKRCAAASECSYRLFARSA